MGLGRWAVPDDSTMGPCLKDQVGRYCPSTDDRFSRPVAPEAGRVPGGPVRPLTRRDVRLPAIGGKALAVIGVRRSGKTSFLAQCRADRIAGESPPWDSATGGSPSRFGLSGSSPDAQDPARTSAAARARIPTRLGITAPTPPRARNAARAARGAPPRCAAASTASGPRSPQPRAANPRRPSRARRDGGLHRVRGRRGRGGATIEPLAAESGPPELVHTERLTSGSDPGVLIWLSIRQAG